MKNLFSNCYQPYQPHIDELNKKYSQFQLHDPNAFYFFMGSYLYYNKENRNNEAWELGRVWLDEGDVKAVIECSIDRSKGVVDDIAFVNFTNKPIYATFLIKRFLKELEQMDIRKLEFWATDGGPGHRLYERLTEWYPDYARKVGVRFESARSAYGGPPLDKHLYEYFIKGIPKR